MAVLGKKNRKKAEVLYNMWRKNLSAALCAAMLLSAAAGCAERETGYLPADTQSVELTCLEDEAVALAAAPAAVPAALEPERGVLVKANNRAEIDYSNTEDGYVMVRPLLDSGKRWKALVKGSSTTYTYNLTPGSWSVFPCPTETGTTGSPSMKMYPGLPMPLCCL